MTTRLERLILAANPAEQPSSTDAETSVNILDLRDVLTIVTDSLRGTDAAGRLGQDV